VLPGLSASTRVDASTSQDRLCWRVGGLGPSWPQLSDAPFPPQRLTYRHVAPAFPTKSCLPQAMEQIAYADRIILNKTDLVSFFHSVFVAFVFSDARRLVYLPWVWSASSARPTWRAPLHVLRALHVL